jgi:hypothetical protein
MFPLLHRRHASCLPHFCYFTNATLAACYVFPLPQSHANYLLYIFRISLHQRHYISCLLYFYFTNATLADCYIIILHLRHSISILFAIFPLHLVRRASRLLIIYTSLTPHY